LPTHQGKTQTDIVIGDGGDSVSEHTEFEFTATYSGSGNLQYADLAPGTDRQYGAYELIISDPATGGATLATMAARYKAGIDVGSAKGKKTINIGNTFTPAPTGSTPNWPLAYQTSADRVWRVDTFDKKSNLYASAWATWSVRTTVAVATAYVIQTVVDQTPAMLRVHLVYLNGSTVLLDTVVTMLAGVTITGLVTQDPPDITDTFSP
jgi:hypothetical protein